jgi:hypothetical protein
MKKNLILCSIFLLFSIANNGIIAQHTQRMTYEQKEAHYDKMLTDALRKAYGEFTSAIGKRLSQRDQNILSRISSPAEMINIISMMQISNEYLTYKMAYPESYNALHERLGKEMDSVIDIMEADVEFMRERNRRKDAEKELLERQEAEREQKEQQERFERSDFGQLRNGIRNKFVKWAERGQFETTNDYENRLRSESVPAFYRICYEELGESINGRRRTLIKLEEYNADQEYFLVKYEDISGNFFVPIDIARRMDIGAGYIYRQGSQSAPWTMSIWWASRFSDWCFIDNKLFPRKIFITIGSHSGEMSFSIENAQEIKFDFKDLGIENVFAQNAVFDASILREIETETRRQQMQQLEKNTINEVIYRITNHYSTSQVGSSDFARITYNSHISRHRGQFYYPNLVEAVIKTIKRLNTAWNREGQYFDNQVEFYEAFVSQNYSQILKEKKRNSKRR